MLATNSTRKCSRVGKPIEVRKNADSKKNPVKVRRAGWVKGSEHYAVLSGYVLVTSLEWAVQILELCRGRCSAWIFSWLQELRAHKHARK